MFLLAVNANACLRRFCWLISSLAFRTPGVANMSAGGSGIKMVSGKIVCEVYLLDNSMKTLLIEPSSTVQVRTLIACSGPVCPLSVNLARR